MVCFYLFIRHRNQGAAIKRGRNSKWCGKSFICLPQGERGSTLPATPSLSVTHRAADPHKLGPLYPSTRLSFKICRLFVLSFPPFDLLVHEVRLMYQVLILFRNLFCFFLFCVCVFFSIFSFCAIKRKFPKKTYFRRSVQNLFLKWYKQMLTYCLSDCYWVR